MLGPGAPRDLVGHTALRAPLARPRRDDDGQPVLGRVAVGKAAQDGDVGDVAARPATGRSSSDRHRVPLSVSKRHRRRDERHPDEGDVGPHAGENLVQQRCRVAARAPACRHAGWSGRRR